MPAQRLSMRKTREILRLRWGLGLAGRQVARSCNVSPSTVYNVMGRAQLAGLSWPLPEDLDDAALDALLYPGHRGARDRPLPDFAAMHRELKRKGVTLQLLWCVLPPTSEGPSFSGITGVPGTHHEGVKLGPKLAA